MELTVEILKDLAKQNKVPYVITEMSYSDECFLEYNEDYNINLHCNSKICLRNDGDKDVVHFWAVVKFQNMFEEAYQGFHLDIERYSKNYCTLVIRKNDIESLKISEDYKLATEKMAEVREVRKLIEETKDIQKESATRINDLFKKLAEVREYAGKLQLKEENAKKVSEQLDNINSDIKELEIRLKKDIPELDKSLDINNFR
jgi:hypothetical protein